MSRVLSACAVFLAVAGVGAGAAAPALADWRYDDDWRWRSRPPHHHPHHPPARDVMMVYPSSVWPPGPPPRVVYVEPVQAFPVSPPYTDAVGRYCREYQTSVMVGGMARPGYGTACLMPDGQWRVVR